MGGSRYNRAMLLDQAQYYEALRTHDPRFDGLVFVGVGTTGIYCRTVCTARTPLQKNCTFYPSAAAAERAGYRPCLRCRPELAPGRAPIDAFSRTGALIAARLEGGALSGATVSELASELGLSPRHLRRIVQSEFGVSPIELAQTQRLHTALRLLSETALPITEIAFASGFSSVRRFNALFCERYHQNPSDYRNRPTISPRQDTGAVRCTLSYRPPFDWRSLLRFLGARAIPGVERVTIADDTQTGQYFRTARINQYCGWISVTHREEYRCLVVEISHSLAPVMQKLLARLRRLFDLHAEPEQIARHLGELAARNPGLRVPGCFDSFELAIRAVCGQQITVRGATTIIGRIASLAGSTLEGVPSPTSLAETETCPQLIWPRAEQLASFDQVALKGCGVTARRADTLIALSEAIASGEIRLEPGVDIEQTTKELKRINGIGEWTAQYIAMRALSWPDAFPHSDLAIMKALGVTNTRASLELAELWRPWRSYAAMHLWRSLETNP